MEITVTDFGPISAAKVHLRPLTIFVGPNNSGKSYLAALVYSVLGAHPGGILGSPDYLALIFDYRSSAPDLRSAGDRGRLAQPMLRSDSEFLLAHRDDLFAWLRDHGAALGATWPVQTLPDFLRQRLGLMAEDAFAYFGESLQSEITRCLAASVQELLNAATHAESFTVTIRNHDPRWSFAVSFSPDAPASSQFDYDLSNVQVGTRDLGRALLRAGRATNAGAQAQAWRVAQADIAADIVRAIFGDFSHSVYYLPAARSGIMQSHKALISAVVQRSAFAGVQRLNVATLSGVVADFISLLISMPRTKKGKLENIARLFEEDVIGGDIVLDATETSSPEIYYRSRQGRFPLYRTSSMIAELAPVALLLKHVAEQGDLLIIEEPESHLHPANQRKFAAAIAAMVRAGLRVLLTTHSDYFLSELSNCVLRGAHRDGRADYLLPEEVGAYLFAIEGATGASTVQELPVTAEDGIPEQSFTEVAEALYDETVQLQEAVTP